MMPSCTEPSLPIAPEAAIAAAYRCARNEALAAAMAQRWTQWRRLTEMAAMIAVSHTWLAERARFSE